MLPLVLGEFGGVTICPTAGLTGLPCPGCGLTRAGVAALRGDPGTALAYHPLIFLVGPAVGGYAGLALIDAFRPLEWFRARTAERWMSRGTAALAFLLFAVWLARFAGGFGGPVPTHPWFW